MKPTLKQKTLAALLSSYFSLGVGAPLSSLPASLVVNGALVDTASLISTLQQMNQANIAGDSYPFNSSAGASITLTAIQNLTQKLTNGGAVTVTLDSAYNIVNTIFNPFVGLTFQTIIQDTAGTTVATPTLSDTAVTLAGTTTVTTGGSRYLQGQITQVVTTVGAALTAGTTFTSLTQVGSTNNYTLALGTNAISPTVGQVIYINNTSAPSATQLPSGWYPINKVNSATSFVIAAPLGTTWAITSATLPGTTVVPVSQYQTGLLGIYSPLLTITGMYGMAAGVIVT